MPCKLIKVSDPERPRNFQAPVGSRIAVQAEGRVGKAQIMGAVYGKPPVTLEVPWGFEVKPGLNLLAIIADDTESLDWVRVLEVCDDTGTTKFLTRFLYRDSLSISVSLWIEGV